MLDDGPETGLRAMAFSTGGGLDFWVLSDRSLDIGPLWWRGMAAAWQHPSGYLAPALHHPNADQGTGIERALSGFMVSCGAEHMRQPANGHPLHGNLPLTPARITSYGENWDAAVPHLFCEGEVTVSHLSKSSYRLTRRIEAPVGGATFRILDRIENIGLRPQELAMLYHINFGFPAVGQNTSVEIDDIEVLTVGLPDKTATELKPRFACHAVAGPDTARTILKRRSNGHWPGFQAEITTQTDRLPYVQIWADPRPGRNIVAIEPATSDRQDDGTSKSGDLLHPGQIWTSQLDFEFSSPD
uniref:DUF4432 family protein n=1 Tax=Pararhizobium sp. IMCC3301 TaxID=3067904 RepID=UPI003531D09D